MSAVRSVDSAPEVAVRRTLHRLGYRFRLHRKDLPGRPDITLPMHRAVIFVHGCFWHQHSGCPRARRPTSRRDYWEGKLDGNIERDRAVQADLERAGWRVVVIWECETRDREALARRLSGWFEGLRER